MTTLNTTGSEINFTEAPGQHGYEIGPVPGYESEPGSGTATVLAANQTVPVAFTKLAPGQYAVTFTDRPRHGDELVGLHPVDDPLFDRNDPRLHGGQWDVQLLGDRRSRLHPEPVVGPDHRRRIEYRHDRRVLPVPPGKFALTFTETGLPGGSDWSVTIGATTAYSNGGDVVSFQEANGTLTYRVDPVNGYSATPSTGSVVLAGASKNVAVTFSTSVGSASSTGGLHDARMGHHCGRGSSARYRGSRRPDPARSRRLDAERPPRGLRPWRPGVPGTAAPPS